MRAVINEATDPNDKDDAITKVAKFIPGEITALYAALAAGAVAAAGDLTPDNGEAGPRWPLWVAFWVCLVGSPVYWYATSKRTKEKEELGRTTRWWAYVLAAVAFVPWALAVSEETRMLLGKMPASVAQYLVLLAAVVVPGLNALAEKVWSRT